MLQVSESHHEQTVMQSAKARAAVAALGLALCGCHVPRPLATPPDRGSDLHVAGPVSPADAIPLGNGNDSARLWGDGHTVTLAFQIGATTGALQMDFPTGTVERLALDLRRATATAQLGSAEIEAFVSATDALVMVRCRGSAPTARITFDDGTAHSLVADDGTISPCDHSSGLRGIARRRPEQLEIAIAAGDPLRTGSNSFRSFVRQQDVHIVRWRQFWGASSVDLPDDDIQALYDRSKYAYGAGLIAQGELADAAMVAGLADPAEAATDRSADDRPDPEGEVEALRALTRRVPGWSEAEPRSKAMTAIHAMLLRVEDGVVQLFPGVPPSWREVSFENLRLPGGHWISARRTAGVTSEVTIYASSKTELAVADPFPGALAFWNGGLANKDGVLRATLERGQKLSGSIVLPFDSLTLTPTSEAERSGQ